MTEYFMMAASALSIVGFGVMTQKYLTLCDEFNDLLHSCRLVAAGQGEFVLLQDDNGTQEVAYICDDEGDE